MIDFDKNILNRSYGIKLKKSKFHKILKRGEKHKAVHFKATNQNNFILVYICMKINNIYIICNNKHTYITK